MAQFRWTRKIERTLSEIVARCWVDPGFKRQFIANPTKVLKAAGVDFGKSRTPKVYPIRAATLVRIEPVSAQKKPAKDIVRILLPPPPADLSRSKPRGHVARSRSITVRPGHVVLTIGNARFTPPPKDK